MYISKRIVLNLKNKCRVYLPNSTGFGGINASEPVVTWIPLKPPNLIQSSNRFTWRTYRRFGNQFLKQLAWISIAFKQGSCSCRQTLSALSADLTWLSGGGGVDTGNLLWIVHLQTLVVRLISNQLGILNTQEKQGKGFKQQITGAHMIETIVLKRVF